MLRVHWRNYPPEEDTWEPEAQLVASGVPHLVEAYWNSSGLDRDSDIVPTGLAGVNYCRACCKSFKRPRDLKGHNTRFHKPPVVLGSRADKDIRARKSDACSSALPQVECGDRPLDNVVKFRYLGTMFHAFGGDAVDVYRRCAMAMDKAGKLRSVWRSSSLPCSLKMRVYKSIVCSVLLYGCESWLLDKSVVQKLNGVNSRIVSWITKKTVREEASSRTRSFDMVSWVRARRLTWLRQILRMDSSRDIHKLVKYMFDERFEGDLLADAPDTDTFEELVEMAVKSEEWLKMVKELENASITRRGN